MFGNENQESDWIDNTPKIRVVIRKRPISKKEVSKSDVDIIDIRGPQTIVVREMKCKVDLTKYIEEHNFNFDAAYGESINNESLYSSCVQPLVDAAFHGAKVTCFAYGQTGSGKTYTMMGDSALQEGRETADPVPGLYLLASIDIFKILNNPNFKNMSIWISFYEIYCGKLYDLLNSRALLQAREDAKQNVNIVGLVEKKVLDVESLMEIIEFGNSNRVTGVTGANSDSSRSHAILQIVIKNKEKFHGKMSFIDLAGSERGADVVDQNKQTRFDGAEINKSLLALKECIRALDQDKRHTPFRGSKLTLVLKDSFTGNCKTLMIGNISPCGSSCEHTLNTLRYADRVKELKKPQNQDLENGLNNLDLLSKQLMLARQTKNTTIVPLQGQNYTDFTAQQLKKQTSNVGQKQYIYKNNFLNGDDFQEEPELFPTPEPTTKVTPHKETSKDKTRPKTGNIQSTNSLGAQKVAPSNNLGKVQNTNISKTNSSITTTQATKSKSNISTPQSTNKHPSSHGIQGGSKGNQHLGMLNQHLNLEQDDPYGKILNEDELMDLSQKHERLIEVILAEEEEVITLHRQHIDDMVELVKQEMSLLNEVDKPGSDVDEYADNLDAILAHKLEIISLLRGRILRFKSHLREEEQISRKFNEQRFEMRDVFDLGEGMEKNEEIRLLDNLPTNQ